MRFYMVQGDIMSPGPCERAMPAEPVAIFCVSATQHHTGWRRLTAHAIHLAISERDFGDISMPEYERGLQAIEKHRAWQAEVMRRRGYSDPRPRVGRSKKQHPAIKETSDVGQQQSVEAGGDRQPARAPDLGVGAGAPAH